jgi:hypothetical protein
LQPSLSAQWVAARRLTTSAASRKNAANRKNAAKNRRLAARKLRLQKFPLRKFPLRLPLKRLSKSNPETFRKTASRQSFFFNRNHIEVLSRFYRGFVSRMATPNNLAKGQKGRFSKKNLHISNKSSTFAADLEKVEHLYIKYE